MRTKFMGSRIRLAALTVAAVWLLTTHGISEATQKGQDAATAARSQIGSSRTALVSVLDPRGRAIVDVEIDDFVVRETGKPRDVLSVRVADYPIALVLDNSRGSARDFDSIRDAASRFARRVGARPIAVAMAEPPQLVATFDDERAVVLDRIERSRISEERADSAGRGLFDAIVAAARAVQDSGPLFSGIVVLTANLFGEAPGEVLTPVLTSGATLNVIANVSDGNASGSAGAILREGAQRTQGQFTQIFSAASYEIALERLADRLAPELMIEYLVPPGSSNSDDVQLGVRIPGARVVTVAVK